MDTITLAFLAASSAFNLPPGLLSAVCFVESSHKPYAIKMDDNGSPSIGICQIKQKTARWLGYKGTETQLRMDVNANAYYAAKYLHYTLSRYHGDRYCGIGAYNAGHCGVTYGKAKNDQYIKKVLQAWKEGR